MTTEKGTVTLDQLARFMRIFAGRTNVFGQSEPSRAKRSEDDKAVDSNPVTKSEALTQLHYEDHLAGRRRLGVCPDTGDGCYFGALDVDGKYLAARFPDQKREAAVKQVAAQVRDLGLPLMPIFSKSRALHLYFFSFSRVAADKIQHFMKYYATQLELRVVEDSLKNKLSPEIFPKGDMSWINVSYFGNSTCQAIAPDGELLSLDDFLNEAESLASENAALLDGTDYDGAECDPDVSVLVSLNKDGYSPYLRFLMHAVLKELADGKHEGRNRAGLIYFMRLRDAGVTRETAVATLPEWVRLANEEAPGDPYTAEEAKATLKYVYRHPPRPRNVSLAGFPPHHELRTAPFEWGGGIYSLVANGTRFSRMHLCSFMYIKSYCQDIETGDWYRILTFADRRGVRHDVPLAEGAQDNLEWLNDAKAKGFLVYNKVRFREFFLKYHLPEFGLCASRTGWHRNEQIYVLPEKTFGTHEQVQLTTDPDHRLHIRGTADEWRAHIGALCSGNTLLVFGVNAVFAAILVPLISDFGAINPGVHYYGPTSTGKTTIFDVAGSVLGAGRDGKEYYRSWNSTAVGIEMMAAEHHCLPLLLDEMGIETNADMLSKIIYMVASGEGRARGTANITAAKTPRWRTFLQSTGEKTPADLLREGGRSMKGGQDVRVLSIPSTLGPYGVFQNLHGRASGKDFSNELKLAAHSYHGAPLREFLEKLLGQRSELIERFRFRAVELAREWSAKGQAEVPRAAQTVAIVAAAGEIAAELGVTGFDASECKVSAHAVFNHWLEARGTTGSIDEERSIEHLRGVVQSGWLSKFEDLDDTTREVPARNGGTVLVEKDRPRLLEHAGYRKRVKGGSEVWIKGDFFKNQCCLTDYKALCALLVKRGILRKLGNEQRYEIFRTPPKDVRQRFFVVLAEKLECIPDDAKSDDAPESDNMLF